MGDHLRHLPRYGRRLRGGDRRHLHSGRSAIRSLKLPLVILTPIPLTLIGIMFGHWLVGAPFTATSMIRLLALAGIIVRNSILLVDVIRHGWRGKKLREVLLKSGAVRFKPILMTALAAVIGAATILLDSIFQSLAISLLFGLASSTLLTVLVIPAIYVALLDADQKVHKFSLPRSRGARMWAPALGAALLLDVGQVRADENTFEVDGNLPCRP
jgi:predicted RND superfamily exporter protein